jgi:hypothetical protein
MTVTPPHAELPTLSIVRAVERAGMRAEPWKDASEVPAPGRGRLRDGRTIATVASGVFLLGGFIGHAILAGLGPAWGLAEASGAHAVLDELRGVGTRKVVMLTGDNQGTASVVGAETGVDEVRAELLPEDKVTAVESLVSQIGTVAMVSDGVNDAPATVGIAMGAVGSDAAIETADIALMSDARSGEIAAPRGQAQRGA